VLISANLKFDCVLEHKASVRDGSSFRWKLGVPELDKDKRKMLANCLDIPPKHRDSGFQLRVKEFDPFSTMVLSVKTGDLVNFSRNLVVQPLAGSQHVGLKGFNIYEAGESNQMICHSNMQQLELNGTYGTIGTAGWCSIHFRGAGGAWWFIPKDSETG